MAGKTTKPGRDCPLCPRLVAFRETGAQREPAWFNAPVPSFGPARRAPADRRPRAGPARRQPHRTAVHRRLRRRSALRHAEGIRFRAAAPSRRAPTTGWSWSMRASPTPCAACRRKTSRRRPRSTPAANFSFPPSRRCRTSRAIVALGRIAHETTVQALGAKRAAAPFRHGGASRDRPRSRCSPAITARATTPTPAC